MICSFVVDENPIGKGRPRVTMHGTFTPQKTKDYEEAVAKVYKQMKHPMFPNDVPLYVKIELFMQAPLSLTKKKRNELIGTWHTKKPDCDNCAKAILDALNGVAYEDDSSVAQLEVEKAYADKGYSRITIATIDYAEF